jgi:hypothetical protein
MTLIILANLVCTLATGITRGAPVVQENSGFSDASHLIRTEQGTVPVAGIDLHTAIKDEKLTVKAQVPLGAIAQQAQQAQAAMSAAEQQAIRAQQLVNEAKKAAEEAAARAAEEADKVKPGCCGMISPKRKQNS